MNKLQNIIIEHRLASLIVCLFLFVGFGYGAAHVQKKSGVESLLAPENSLMIMKEKMSQVFGNPNLVFIMTRASQNSDDEVSQLAKLYAIATAIDKNDMVEKLVSPFNVKVAESSPEGFTITDLARAPPKNETELQQFKNRLDELPSFRGQIVSLDGQAYGLIIQFKKTAPDAAIKALLLGLLAEQQVEDWPLSGLPVINAWVLEFIDADQAFLVPAFFLFIIVILYLAFGTLRSIFLTLMNIIVAIVFMIAAMVLFGAHLNVVTDVLPLLIAALAAAYSVHYLNQYYLSFAQQPESATRIEVLRDTAKRIMPTIAMAALTTVFGFLASVTSAIPAVRDFSIFASFGVLGVIIALLLFTPTALMLLPKGKVKTVKGRHQQWITSTLNGCARLSARHPRKIVGISIGIIIVSAVASYFVTSKYSALDYFTPKARVVKDARAVSMAFGGFSSFDIVISHPEQALNVHTMQVLDQFGAQIKRENPEDIKVTFSLADSAKEIRKAYNGDQKYFDLPASDDEWSQYLEMYEWSANFRKDFENFISPDGQKIRITGKFSVIEEGSDQFHERPVQYHSELIESWLQFLRSNLGEGYTVEAYGDVPLWSHVVDEVIRGQIRSIILAVLIIFLVTSLVIRSVSIGLICMVPVTMAVLINFLFMAVCGIQLDIATSLISGMALGIGIDDTIHFTLGLREANREAADFSTAVQNTLLNSGRAIIYTSIALTAGFCTYFISNFQPIIHFGLLNAITLVTTTIAAVIVLPSYFVVFKPKFFKGDKS